MSHVFWRLIIAGIAVVLLYAAIPPFVALLGFSIDSNLMTLLRVCIAAIAIFYVISGPPLRVG